MEQIAEISDKFTRNEILSANEIRQGIGFKPSTDPKADQLVNSNMPQPGSDMGYGAAPPTSGDPEDEDFDETDEGGDLLQSGLEDLNALADSILAELGAPDG